MLADRVCRSGIPNIAQPEILLEYKVTPFAQYFKPDFICYGKIIVEIKAVANLIDARKAQALNYLSATKFDLALLVNFGQFPKLAYERLANNRKSESANFVMDEMRKLGLDNT
jgi:GxxExxY protein